MNIKIGSKVRIAIGILVFALIITSLPCLSVNAISKELQNGDLVIKNTPTETEIFGMYEEQGTDIELNEQSNDSMEYTVYFDTGDGKVVKSDIVSTTNSDGDVVLEINEEGKKDILTYESDGTICVDGVPVKIKEEKEKYEKDALVSLNNNSVYAAQRTYFTSSCPYGSTSSYTGNKATTKKSFSISKPFKEASLALVLGIITAGFTALFNVPGALLSAGIAGLSSWFSKNDPKAKAWSMKDIRTTHKTKGLNVSSNMSVQYHVITYYAKTNYTYPTDKDSKLFKVWKY